MSERGHESLQFVSEQPDGLVEIWQRNSCFYVHIALMGDFQLLPTIYRVAQA